MQSNVLQKNIISCPLMWSHFENRSGIVFISIWAALMNPPLSNIKKNITNQNYDYKAQMYCI